MHIAQQRRDIHTLIADTTLHDIRQDTSHVVICSGHYQSRILHLDISDYHRVFHFAKQTTTYKAKVLPCVILTVQLTQECFLRTLKWLAQEVNIVYHLIVSRWVIVNQAEVACARQLIRILCDTCTLETCTIQWQWSVVHGQSTILLIYAHQHWSCALIKEVNHIQLALLCIFSIVEKNLTLGITDEQCCFLIGSILWVITLHKHHILTCVVGMHEPRIERFCGNIHLSCLDIITKVDLLIAVECTIIIEPCNILADSAICLVVALEQCHGILIAIALRITVDLRRNSATILHIYRDLGTRLARR